MFSCKILLSLQILASPLFMESTICEHGCCECDAAFCAGIHSQSHNSRWILREDEPEQSGHRGDDSFHGRPEHSASGKKAALATKIDDADEKTFAAVAEGRGPERCERGRKQRSQPSENRKQIEPPTGHRLSQSSHGFLPKLVSTEKEISRI